MAKTKEITIGEQKFTLQSVSPSWYYDFNDECGNTGSGKRKSAKYMDGMFKNCVVAPAEVKAKGMEFFDDNEDLKTAEKLVSEDVIGKEPASQPEEIPAEVEEPVAEETPVAEDVPAFEDDSAQDDIPIFEDVPPIADAPAPEEIPAPDDTSEKGRSFMDRIPDVDDGMEESYDSRLTEPEIGSEIIPDESAMDSHGMLEHGEEEPPFDPSILDDPDLQELPEEPAEPEPSKDEIAEQEYRDSDGDFDAAEDAPTPERKASGRQRPVKKGRPKKTRGEGLLGIPHILVTIVWLALIVVIGVTLGRMIWVCAADVLAFGRENKPVTITIYESDTMDSITDKLYDAGLIRYKSLFNFYADISHAEKKIDPGIYDLNTRYDYHALVNMMSASSTREVVEDLLIPEGYTCRQIFALLEENRICTAQDLSAYAANGALKDYWFLENVTRGDKYCLEGFLFPDTYDFYKNSSPREVLEKMLDNFDYRFSEEMRAQIDTLNATVTDGSFTVREVTIVASLIEKETASASESPRIAGVIYNRLFHWDYPALLNIDAAIIYAQDGVSDHIDTSLDSPYNTYLHVGLTPTPIANPGLASLQAALNPESHNYYYYVLNPATGAHQFSTTQEEHEQYRAQFAAAAAAASTQSEGE